MFAKKKSAIISKLRTFRVVIVEKAIENTHCNSVNIGFVAWERLFACSVSDVPQLKHKKNTTITYPISNLFSQNEHRRTPNSCQNKTTGIGRTFILTSVVRTLL